MLMVLRLDIRTEPIHEINASVSRWVSRSRNTGVLQILQAGSSTMGIVPTFFNLESDIRAPVAQETDGYVEMGKYEEGLGVSFAIEGTDLSPIRKHDLSEAVRHTHF